MKKRKVSAMVVIIYLLSLWFQGNEKDEVDNITETESFEEIIKGDMSSLYQIEKEDRDFIKQLAQNGYNEWSLCDINGDGKQELILQERQGELEGNIRHIIAIFAETEEGVKRVLWDIFETGEFYSFIDGRLIHYCYVNGTYNADFYYRCIFDDDWEMREDRLFEILDVTSLDEYDFLSDEMKKEIPSVGFYYRYVTYGENDRETAALLSEDEWRDMFKEEMGEYGRVSTFMHRFAPFDIYVGEVIEENTDNQSDENNQVTQESETDSLENKIERTYEAVQSMDFTANEAHMDVTPEENREYLEAYLKVLKNEMPVCGGVYTGVQEEYYYEDLWRAGIEFETLLEEKAKREFQYLYYYDDLDGDGKPEFAINQGCLFIFNYELGGEIIMRYKVTMCSLLVAVILLIGGCSNGKNQDNLFETESAIETEDTEETETEMSLKAENEETDPVFKEYPYYLDYNILSVVSHGREISLENKEGMEDIWVPVIYIPEDREKENRINEKLWNRCIEVLPMDKELVLRAEIDITYRSERYLCFEYVFHPSLPEGYDDKLFKFTIDMEQEECIDYPEVDKEARYEGKVFSVESIDREANEYLESLEKAAGKQSELWGETGYELCEKKIEFSGITAPCAQIVGLDDEELQEKINIVLQEPFAALSLCGDWEEHKDDSLGKKIAETQIYVAYKSRQWLSVIYSIEYQEALYGVYNGKIEFGVTVNMQTGERCMLDDFVDINALSEWCSVNLFYYDNEQETRDDLESAVLTETEQITQRIAQQYSDSLDDSLRSFRYSHPSFYISPGRLMIMGKFYNDVGMPLPEIYQWLKVDPWYGE